jgi:hypothetical protein
MSNGTLDAAQNRRLDVIEGDLEAGDAVMSRLHDAAPGAAPAIHLTMKPSLRSCMQISKPRG